MMISLGVSSLLFLSHLIRVSVWLFFLFPVPVPVVEEAEEEVEALAAAVAFLGGGGGEELRLRLREREEELRLRLREREAERELLLERDREGDTRLFAAVAGLAHFAEEAGGADSLEAEALEDEDNEEDEDNAEEAGRIEGGGAAAGGGGEVCFLSCEGFCFEGGGEGEMDRERGCLLLSRLGGAEGGERLRLRAR